MTARLLLSFVLMQAKSILSAIYFSCDHVVWAGQTGIFGDKVSSTLD